MSTRVSRPTRGACSRRGDETLRSGNFDYPTYPFVPPVELREKVTLDGPGAAALARSLGDAVCLSTCNRTELYLADVPEPAAVEALEHLAGAHHLELDRARRRRPGGETAGLAGPGDGQPFLSQTAGAR